MLKVLLIATCLVGFGSFFASIYYGRLSSDGIREFLPRPRQAGHSYPYAIDAYAFDASVPRRLQTAYFLWTLYGTIAVLCGLLASVLVHYSKGSALFFIVSFPAAYASIRNWRRYRRV